MTYQPSISEPAEEASDKKTEQLLLEGRYHILRKLGVGNSGGVYAAEDNRLHRMAAVKISPFAERLESELSVMLEAVHPAFPMVFDYVVFDHEVGKKKTGYLVMEYIEGITLLHLIQEWGRLPEEKAVEIAASLAEAVSVLHRRGHPIIHRDIKPANIILQPDGRVRLVDFGAAAVAGAEYPAGTAGYAAPEQWGGESDERTDIFGLGAVLHEMVTGVHPVLPPCGREPVRRYRSTLSKGLERIIDRCLEQDKADRYGSMEELLFHLNNYPRWEGRGRGIRLSQRVQEPVYRMEKYIWRTAKEDKGLLF